MGLSRCGPIRMTKDQQKISKVLWDSFDHASWVNPQIAATISMIDADFVEKALERLHNGVLIKNPDEYLTDMFKTDRIENPKGFMSLWGLLEEKFNCEDLLTPDLLLLKERVGEKDKDFSADIALGWRKEIECIINA